MKKGGTSGPSYLKKESVSRKKGRGKKAGGKEREETNSRNGAISHLDKRGRIAETGRPRCVSKVRGNLHSRKQICKRGEWNRGSRKANLTLLAKNCTLTPGKGILSLK